MDPIRQEALKQKSIQQMKEYSNHRMLFEKALERKLSQDSVVNRENLYANSDKFREKLVSR